LELDKSKLEKDFAPIPIENSVMGFFSNFF